MIDFFTIGLLSVALMGLLAGDALLNANTLSVNISVPPTVIERGLTREAAEHIFAAEAARLVEAPSTISAPSVRISSERNVIGVLAEPLQLGDMTAALQDLFGLQPLRVRAMLLMEEEGRQRLVMTVSNQDLAARQVDVVRRDGDTVRLIRDGAYAAIELVSPYRVALTGFQAGLAGNAEALERARGTLTRAVQRPMQRGRESEFAGLLTITGLLHLLEDDLTAAERAFLLAAEVPALTEAARSVGDMNLAFIAIARNQPEAALAFARAARDHAALGNIRLPSFAAHLDIIEALAQWEAGELERAAALLERAAALLPDDETAHAYLERLYGILERPEAVALAQRHRANSRSFAGAFPSIAASLFWVEPGRAEVHPRLR